MALITCPECGKEISNKASFCIGCGCPMENREEKKEDLDILIDDIYSRNKDRVKAIKELREKTGLDLKSAKDIMDKKYNGITQEEKDKIIKEEAKQARRESLESLSAFSDSLTTARCPRCRSTSITYQNKRLSVGRAIAGDVIAGPTGAVLGGLSSKNGYAVCLKCGKRWKV